MMKAPQRPLAARGLGVLAALLLGIAVAMPLHAAEPDFWLGTSIDATQGRRTIEIGPDTRWVNVTHRESVRFVINGQSFGWRFDGPGARAVDLQRIAPAGLLNRPLTVYVAHLGEYSPVPF